MKNEIIFNFQLSIFNLKNAHWKPNREERNEQIVVYREKLVRRNFKRFFRTKSRVTISSGVGNKYIIYDGQEKNKCELKVFLIYNPKNKQLFAKLKQKKLNIPKSWNKDKGE